MSSKKNIDRLFQEKFKEFDVKPDPKVWQNIESKLKKEKKEDRVVIIPFWLKLSGIAASLLFLFFLGDALYNSSENSTIPSVVETEKTNGIETNNKAEENNSTKIDLKESDLNKTNNKNTESETSTTVAGTENKVSNNNDKGSISNINTTKKNTYNSNKTSNRLITNTDPTTTISTSNNTVASSNTSITNNSATNNSNSNENIVVSPKNKSNKTINKPLNTTIKNAVVNNEVENKEVQNAVAKNKIESNDDTTKEEELKPSIEDAIADIKETEDLIEKEDANNRWSVNTNIAPVYYNSFGEGSHIHSQFNENTKSGEVNTSYGVKVGYALNDKLTVRSGVNKLNLSYNTEDVVVYEKLGDNSSLRNVDFSTSASGQRLNMISAKSINAIEDSRTLNQGISQEMSYYEVPLEVEYKLLSKRLGINVIGGFSTFLLDNNQIISQLDGVDSKIGEANNINSVSFSTNLGIGIDYKISKAVVFNLEPTFKYHLNAFNNTSGSFNPYIIGLYTGISYRF